MSKKNSSLSNVKLKIQINNLITIYEQKAECGIFFKLGPEKSPLEVLGVLNFLKDRIKKWGNTNLFSYHGSLFKKGAVLVVGAKDLEEAVSIIIYMYLTNVVDNEYGINILIDKLNTLIDLEEYLRTEITINIKRGYPTSPNVESQIKKHLNNIITGQSNNSSLIKEDI
jgi:hypothetical protein